MAAASSFNFARRAAPISARLQSIVFLAHIGEALRKAQMRSAPLGSMSARARELGLPHTWHTTTALSLFRSFPLSLYLAGLHSPLPEKLNKANGAANRPGIQAAPLLSVGAQTRVSARHVFERQSLLVCAKSEKAQTSEKAARDKRSKEKHFRLTGARLTFAWQRAKSF